MTALPLMKGDTPVRADRALRIEPARGRRRLHHAQGFFFEDLDEQMEGHHREALEILMGHERQCFLNAQPCQRTAARTDRA